MAGFAQTLDQRLAAEIREVPSPSLPASHSPLAGADWSVGDLDFNPVFECSSNRDTEQIVDGVDFSD